MLADKQEEASKISAQRASSPSPSSLPPKKKADQDDDHHSHKPASIFAHLISI
jgi:hypothetical protein